jgi:2-hydroxychromene-2-carboxylate isomerase
MAIDISYYLDPGCPWGYSANPALAALRWRYDDQLNWRIVTIGLVENAGRYVERGYTPVRAAKGYRAFRRYGMPFATDPKERMAGTSPACRAIVATRRLAPELEHAAFRALQFGWFTTPLVLDRAEDLREALSTVDGLDAAAVVAAIDDPEVIAAYEADKAQARTAAGGATEAQGKSANSDGLERYTAPSLVFEFGGRRLEGGGFQTIEAYDVLIANLDPTLTRRAPAETPDDLEEAIGQLPGGLVTAEVAAIMTGNNGVPDRAATEDALIDLVGAGRARRQPLGDDALWSLASVPALTLVS